MNSETTEERTRVRLKRTLDLCEAAVSLPPTERENFLQSSCGQDAALRHSVTELIRAHDEAQMSGFMEAPALSYTPPDTDLQALVGQQVGVWRLAGFVKAGGGGSVFLAERADGLFDRQVAVKIINRHLGEQAYHRFEREVSILGALQYPNLVFLHDAGQMADGRPYLVMDYVDGPDLHTWLKTRGALPPNQVLEITQQVCAGLQAAHEKGVIHRDIKPANLVIPLQEALSAKVPGARIDVRQLETSRAIDAPVEVRISGQDIRELRALAEEVKEIFRAIPEADRVRDDWGAESFVANLKVEQDRANLAGLSNLDVAASSAVGISGFEVTSLREGDQQIPIVARLRVEERAKLSDIQNLYVYALQSTAKAPLRQVSEIDYQLQSEKIRRRNQFRTITVSCFPAPRMLPSQVFNASRARLDQFEQALPPGYKMGIGGEREQRLKGFRDLSVVMAVSVIAIFLALVIQFKHAIKPLLVFSAIPFGMVGAFAALAIMGAPFGFIAFLGIASLIGVIVSHVIVLFDFVEERREEGEPLRDALLDAGIARLRPVMITVGATIFGLVPLAMNGGPLWEALCYAQIGGLLLANYVTKLLVPALYAIFVLDLKLIKWHGRESAVTSQLTTTPLTTKPLS